MISGVEKSIERKLISFFQSLVPSGRKKNVLNEF